jgi:hypothetical protein
VERNIDFAEARLRAALEQAERVTESEFTFSDGPDALQLIVAKLTKHLEELAGLRAEGTQDKIIIAAECHKALEAVNNVLPILGLIVRSTDIRNAFEIYGPIRQLARTLIQSDKGLKTPSRLIWSSGWDYIPSTFRRIKYLPGFIIITIPSSESANPLLLPLAGHELGHRIWTDEELEKFCFDSIILGAAEFIKDNFKQSNLGIPKSLEDRSAEEIREYLRKNARQIIGIDTALVNATRQAEELFCDLLGYFLFGESFLHAFSYLLAPRPPQERRISYPKTSTRATLLKSASTKFNQNISNVYTTPTDFVALFRDEEKSPEFLTQVTDHAALKAGIGLIEKVIELSKRENWKNLPALSSVERRTIREECFAWGVPASNAGSLGNILNAAWDAHLDAAFWVDFHPLLLQPKEERQGFRVAALREIVLKSIEVFEYESIRKAHGV